jgi:hypothetical protein
MPSEELLPPATLPLKTSQESPSVLLLGERADYLRLVARVMEQTKKISEPSWMYQLFCVSSDFSVAMYIPKSPSKFWKSCLAVILLYPSMHTIQEVLKVILQLPIKINP